MSGRNAFVSCVVNFLQTDQAASCAALRRRAMPRQQPHDGGLERCCVALHAAAAGNTPRCRRVMPSAPQGWRDM